MLKTGLRLLARSALLLALLLVSAPTFGQRAGGTANFRTINAVRYVDKYADAGAGTVASPWTGWEDAFDSIATTGGHIIFSPGNYTQGADIDVPVGLTGKLTISGYGAEIKLASSFPRFLDIGRTGDNQTLQHIVIEGMTIDADSIGGKHHVIIGNYQTGATTTGQCLNVDDLTIRDVTTKNVLSGDSATNHRLNIWLAVSDSGSCPQSPVTVTNVFVDNVVMNGGNVGVVVAGTTTDPADVYLNNIHIHDSYHDRGGTASAFYTSSNFHIGSRGYGGYAHISGCVGRNSADVGIEVNGFETFVGSDNYIENAYLNAYLNKNFTNNIDIQQQTYQWVNNRVEFTDGTALDGTRRGITLAADGSYDFGNLLIDGFVSVTDTSVIDSDGWCSRMVSDSSYVESVTMKNITCIADSIADTSSDTTTMNALELDFQGTPGTSVVIDGVRVILTGTDAATGTNVVQGLRLTGSGDTNYTVKGVECDFSIVGAANFSLRCVNVGSSAASPVDTLLGSIEGVKIIRMEDESQPRAIVINGSDGTGTTYASKVLMKDNDFSGLPAGGVEVLSTDADTDYILFNSRNTDEDVSLIEDSVGTVKYDVSASDIIINGIVVGETIQTLANDATPSVAGGNIFKTGGTTTITNFDDPVEGQILTVLAEHAITITHGASTIILTGATNFTMASGDTLTLVYDGTNWREVSRVDLA